VVMHLVFSLDAVIFQQFVGYISKFADIFFKPNRLNSCFVG